MPKPSGPQFDPVNLLSEEGHERSYKALFHGTQAQLSVGDVIDPEKSAHPGRRLSFATPSLSAAKRFAKDDEGNPQFVYQVEPVDREDMDSTWVRRMKYFSPPTQEAVSNKGFRILRQIHPPTDH